MPNLKIFIGGEQRHEFGLSAVDGISASHQPLRMHEMPVYRSILRLTNGSTYTFYSSKWGDVNRAGLKLMEAKQKEEDVSLEFQSAVNPKYTVTYAPEEESGPRLVVYIGDRLFLNIPVDQLTETGVMGSFAEPSYIEIVYRNPDKYVDGAEEDSRDNDIHVKFTVPAETAFVKNDELQNILDGEAEGPIHFDAGLNAGLLTQ